MYGTVARLRCKPGGLDWVRAWLDVQSKRGMVGWVSTTLFASEADPTIVWVSVIFESKEAYVANANTPVQDQLYHQMLSGLEEPPDWHDGDVISHLTAQDVANR
ncbi:MAG: hypothetical protein IT299_03960 [Dehalococcoidia bacterium]|nr:hypothetical protein [Dehalococcoidia bacterium]